MAAPIAPEVSSLGAYTPSRTVRVNFSTVAGADSYQLWMEKAGESVYTKVADQNVAPFYYPVTTDGTYSFYVVAYDSVTSSSSPSSTVVMTTVDTVAPATVDASKLSINQQPSLTSGEVTGTAGAVEANVTVEMYADSGLTTLLRSIKASADGSFGPLTVGDASVRAVYLAERDAAGNRGAAIQLDNNISYAGTLSSFSLKADGGDAVVVSFIAPSSARQFRVQYRHAGGAVWSVDYFTVGQNGTTIRLTGLEAGRAYDVRVAPVDANLNVGFWSMGSVRTAGTKVDSVVLPSERVAVAAVTTVSSTTTAASTESTSTPAEGSSKSTSQSSAAVTTPTDNTSVNAPATSDNTANESATNEANPAEASNDNAVANSDQSGSATPWVILAILIVLAGIATGGYFYWFSGPEEVTTAVTPNEEKKSDESTDSTDDADKRW